MITLLSCEQIKIFVSAKYRDLGVVESIGFALILPRSKL